MLFEPPDPTSQLVNAGAGSLNRTRCDHAHEGFGMVPEQDPKRA